MSVTVSAFCPLNWASVPMPSKEPSSCWLVPLTIVTVTLTARLPVGAAAALLGLHAAGALTSTASPSGQVYRWPQVSGPAAVDAGGVPPVTVFAAVGVLHAAIP